jgi:EAL domain-containing protein (putative c-di-GMP-specific phosphodiesterase class I)
LRELPINELKIDKSFIDKILYDENEKALVQSIINIGKNFNMKTLAEGVESNDQVKELKALNCDIFQGYYYSKPLSKENLIEFLKKEKI